MKKLQPIENHLVADTGIEDNQAQAVADERVCGACGETDRRAVYRQDVKNYICPPCLPGYKEVIELIKPLI